MVMNKYCRASEEEWKPRHSNTSFVLKTPCVECVWQLMRNWILCLEGEPWTVIQAVYQNVSLFHQVLAAVQHSAAGTVSVSVVAQLELPSCKHCWVVSGCLLSSSPPQSPSSPTSGEIAHLVCGDRSGSIHCYKITQTASGVSDFPWVKILLLLTLFILFRKLG